MTRAPAAGRQLLLVAVCHRLLAEDFAQRLRTLAARHGSDLRGVVVCNNPAHTRPSKSGDLHFLAGTNDLLDFSGYFEGLEHLNSVWPQAGDDNVLFVNDTLITKHAAGCILGRVLGLDALLRQLQLPAIAGKFDPYRSICLRNPWSGHGGFITTFCFLLNAAAQPLLRRLREDAAADGLFVDASPADVKWGQHIPPDFREFIRAHVSYSASPFIWPAAAESDAGLLHRKACCVYFEGRLSGAVGLEGALVPINAGPRSASDIFVREALSRAWRALRFA